MEIKTNFRKIIGEKTETLICDCGNQMERTSIGYLVLSSLYEYVCPYCGKRTMNINLYPNTYFVYEDESNKDILEELEALEYIKKNCFIRTINGFDGEYDYYKYDENSFYVKKLKRKIETIEKFIKGNTKNE